MNTIDPNVEIQYDTAVTFVYGQKFTIERWSDIKTFTLICTGSHIVQALYTPECITGCHKQEVFNMYKITPIEVLNLFGRGEFNYCVLKLDGELLGES